MLESLEEKSKQRPPAKREMKASVFFGFPAATFGAERFSFIKSGTKAAVPGTLKQHIWSQCKRLVGTAWCGQCESTFAKKDNRCTEARLKPTWSLGKVQFIQHCVVAMHCGTKSSFCAMSLVGRTRGGFAVFWKDSQVSRPHPTPTQDPCPPWTEILNL